MTPERLQQIEELYHSALEREPAERMAFINDSCNGDEELRHEVESLLASYEQAGDFIEEPVHEIAARLIADNQKRSMVGRVIGHYEFIELLGAGGMGEVYLARDKALGRQVALKLLPNYFTKDADRLRRFEQEARAASSLNHPNIVTIYEVGQAEGHHFIATEFIDGLTLRAQMANTKIDLRRALDVAIQVAGALDTAHLAGIVHRDIKPENIMVRRDGYLKILDFGLAKLTERPASTIDAEAATRALVKTNPGMVMGTAQYMSPEQARGVAVDVRTDIWSLGVVLYEMVTGLAPFEGETPSHVIVSLLEKEAPLLSRYSPEVPAELERIVSKALRKNRDERYQTVKDLLLDLKSLKQELEVEAHLGRSAGSDMREQAQITKSREQMARETAPKTAEAIADVGIRHPISSAEYIVSEIKSHKRSVVLALATLVIAVAVVGYFFYFAKGGEAIDSVAVMPLVNVGGDPNTEYLSDGLSDSIINSLSQLPNFKVIALTSTMPYKGQQIDPQVVGRKLNVRAVLTGRLIQRGDELLISTELVDVRDNRRLWGGQYTRKLADIVSVPTEIVQEISAKLRLRLTGNERNQLAKRYTENSEAYQAFLQGYHHLTGQTAAARKKSIEYFEKAIRIDPSYAPAYAALARAYYPTGESFVLLPEESQQKIESALRKAEELDDSLADVHALLGAIRQDQEDWAAAEKEFKRAIELNPNGKGVHWYYAEYLSAVGRNDEAIAEAKDGLEIDPLAPIRVRIVAYEYLRARKYDQAIEFFRKALEMDPTYAPGHWNLGRAYVGKGMYDAAIEELQKAIALDPQPPPVFATALAYAYAVSGKRAEAQKMLDELKGRAKQGSVAPVNFAIVYTGLGEKDRAFEWLEKVYKDRPGPPYLSIDPMLDSLRSDPRFADFARRKGLAT